MKVSAHTNNSEYILVHTHYEVVTLKNSVRKCCLEVEKNNNTKTQYNIYLSVYLYDLQRLTAKHGFFLVLVNIILVTF